MYKKQYEALRANIIRTMGPINKGSKEAEKAKIYFEELSTLNYYDTDKNLILDNYFSNRIEQEATFVGDFAQFEAEDGGCYLSRIKNETINTLKTFD